MKKIINRVTVTGADDSVNPVVLHELHNRFPFVEWGILISKSSAGSWRFPSLEWLAEFRKTLSWIEQPMQLSGHLCGTWVRQVCSGDWRFWKENADVFSMFNRIQLNFHALLHRIDREAFIAGLQHPTLAGKQIIFQLDDVNNELLSEARKAGVNAVGLFDTSGGIGVLPTAWPKATSGYCGYAGGLSPDNLTEQLERISAVCGDGPIWIDVETKVRSDDDSVFDIGKVTRFLEIAEPWLI